MDIFPVCPGPPFPHHLLVDVSIAYPDDPHNALVLIPVLNRDRHLFPQYLPDQCPLCLFPEGLPWLMPIPYLWRINAVQAHTELGAIVCNECHRIPIGDLLDESLDGANVCMGSRDIDKDKQEDKKEDEP
jgi:hypothetical protein